MFFQISLDAFHYAAGVLGAGYMVAGLYTVVEKCQALLIQV
jgi:hypothetical protein